ncbi:MAG: ABC transporter substrate-binding protein [Bacteroidales bacterium]|nr:ABC transporter substrate-binding protein [Bacteroidales bacterium]
MKKRFNLHLFLTIFTISILSYSGCRKTDNPIKTINPITIGVILPMDQEKGLLREKALRTAINLINSSGGVGDGQMIELVIKSSEGTNREIVAAQAARDIIKSNKNPVGFITSFSSCSKGVVEQVALPENYPVVSGAATSGVLSSISPFFQRLCPPDAFEANVLMEQANAYGIERIAIAVEDGETFSTDLANAFQDVFGAGASPKVSFSKSDPSYATKLDQLLANEPDAIFISMLSPAVYEEFITRLSELNVDDRLINTSFILCDAFYTNNILNAQIGMMVGEINGHPKNFGAMPAADTTTSPFNCFQTELMKQFGQEVASYNAQFFDIGFLYAMAIEKTLLNVGTDDKAAFRVRLEYWIRQVSHGESGDPVVMPSLGWKSIKDACQFGGVNYQGASGNCDIDNQGNTIAPYSIFTISGTQAGYSLETIRMVFP